MRSATLPGVHPGAAGRYGVHWQPATLPRLARLYRAGHGSPCMCVPWCGNGPRQLGM